MADLDLRGVAELNLTIRANKAKAFTIGFNNPQTFIGATVTMNISRDFGQSALYALTVGAGVTIMSATQISIAFPLLPPATYVNEIEINTALGDQYLFAGNLFAKL